MKELVTRLIAGSSIEINPDKFQNDMTTFASADDVLTLLVHLGYLTYDFDTCTVHIPNQEVQKEFINCIEDGGWEPVMDAIRKSEELLAATIRGEEETVARMIENAHQENTSILAYNDENPLACVIALAYYSAKKNYVVYRELAGGKRICRYGVCSKKNDTDTGNRCRAEMESDSGSSDHTDQKKTVCRKPEGLQGRSDTCWDQL